MNNTTLYSSKIVKAILVDCKPKSTSLYESAEEQYVVVIEVSEPNVGFQLKEFDISAREKDVILNRIKKGDEVIVFEELINEASNYDIIVNNESVLKNNAENVRRVNDTLESSAPSFDEEEYTHLYKAFEYTYEHMTETSKENVETMYLYFNALAKAKNGQMIMAGTESLIRKSLGFALKQDIPFESLIDLFDLENELNIKAKINDAEDEAKEEFFKTLVATKTKLNTSEEDIFQCFKDLKLLTVGDPVAE